MEEHGGGFRLNGDERWRGGAKSGAEVQAIATVAAGFVCFITRFWDAPEQARGEETGPGPSAPSPRLRRRWNQAATG